MDITFALAGNPNSGKTTLFNRLTGGHAAVGNWPGVTVEKKEGRLPNGAALVDLPGTYSLFPFSPEESLARDFLFSGTPNAVINIVDGTALQRNLYLTLQLRELGLPVVVAVNCMDVLTKRGDALDIPLLSRLLGCPVAGISAAHGAGVGALLRMCERLNSAPVRPQAIDEGEAAIARRYEKIEEILRLCYKKSPAEDVSKKIDKLVLHRVFALPIFALVMFFVYFVSVSWLGKLCANWLTGQIDALSVFVEHMLRGWAAAPWLIALVRDGLFAGAGTILGFVPQMALLFLCLGLLESCGYLARAAFMLDCLLRRAGLSGRCFVPFLLATGCGVPAILSVRTIESPRERFCAAVTCTFLPCGAKLPVLALLGGAVFGGVWWFAPLCYFFGLAAILISGKLLSLHRKRAKDPLFVLELPGYRAPQWGYILKDTRAKVFAFLSKATSVILLSSVAVWFLSAFSLRGGLATTMHESILAVISSKISFVFAPLGFRDWRAAAATLTAFLAKENAAATLRVLCGGAVSSLFTRAEALSFVVFNMLCMPCVAAVSALKRELGAARALLGVLWQTGFAWAVAWLIVNFLKLF